MLFQQFRQNLSFIQVSHPNKIHKSPGEILASFANKRAVSFSFADRGVTYILRSAQFVCCSCRDGVIIFKFIVRNNTSLIFCLCISKVPNC